MGFRRYRTTYLLVIASVILFSYGCQKSTSDYIHLEGNAQGTTFSIIYKDSLQRNYAKEIDSIFRIIDKSMSLWDTTSLISRINKNNYYGLVPDEHFERVFRRAMYFSEKSEGAFDITVSPLVKRWGFYFKQNEKAPDIDEVRSLLACVGWKKVQLEGGVINKANPCLQLDFNAIAPGYTVDVLAQFLEDKEIKNYLVELGGEVRTAGHNAAGKIWQIGIDKPLPGKIPPVGRPLQRILSLNGKSLATSGNYRKFVIIEGKKYSHTINPFTGFPVQHNLLSVSVLADKCMDADAYATVFMVMGLEKSLQKAKEWNLEIFCVYENEKGEYREAMTGEWK